MSQAQTAIVPEAGPFALYTQLKVNQNRENVLEKLKALPKLVEELKHYPARCSADAFYRIHKIVLGTPQCRRARRAY